MIRKLLFLLILAVCLPLSAQKSAILVVQFGTSLDEGRAASLDVLFDRIQKSHSTYEVREAYASPRIRAALQKRGIVKKSAEEALLQLSLDGYEKVYVQPTFLMDGVEMNLLREDVQKVSPFFKEIKVGVPILYDIEDCQKVCEVLKKRPAARNEGIMYVGHGNEYASNAIYSMLSNMLKADGMENVYMGTVEGWPDLETSVAQLKGAKLKTVTLIPFLLSSGVHAHEDIDGDWRPALEEMGFKVEVYFHGLGENPEFQSILFEHLETLLK